uniref:hypothetical protein n=1 Tax=Sinorhizobium chiapasense TaxID=501572 RepID=UPI002FE1D2FD
MEIAHEIKEEGVVSGAGRRVRMLAAKTPAHNLIFKLAETVLLCRQPRCGRNILGRECRRQQSQRGHDHLREM